MRQFTVYTAAALALAAVLASAPARAEMNYGPNKNGSQCWKATPGFSGNSGGTFGWWEPCPQPASATVTPRHRRHHSA